MRYQELTTKGPSSNGNFLLTGSVSLTMIPALAQAMVGRMATVTLLPFSVAEVIAGNSNFLANCFSKNFIGIKLNMGITLLEAIKKSTFPAAYNLSTSYLDN